MSKPDQFMENENKTKLFSRSNLVIWGALIFGVLSVQIIFGWSGGIAGIAWKVVPIVIGILVGGAFFWLGRFLSARMNWQLRLLVLAVASSVSVSTIFALLVFAFSSNAAEDYQLFLPGQTVFYLVLFFSAVLTALGFCSNIAKH